MELNESRMLIFEWPEVFETRAYDKKNAQYDTRVETDTQ